jgi:CBS domain-containing protein
LTLVKEIMRKDVIVMDGSKSVLEAVKLMAKSDVSSVIVSKDDSIVGIVTERDVVRKVVAEQFEPDEILLENIMTTPLITISQEATVEDASKAMVTYGIRRLPVVDEERLEGIVTATDIARHVAAEKDYRDSRLNAVARISPDELPPSYG